MGPVYNLKTSIEQGAPEIDVVIDRNMASIYGLTADNISAQLKDLLMGKNAGNLVTGPFKGPKTRDSHTVIGENNAFQRPSSFVNGMSSPFASFP
jgi:hypothetical protein